jgi:hypothetical protein
MPASPRGKLLVVNVTKGVLGNLYGFPIALESQQVTHAGAGQRMFILGPLGPKQIAIFNSILFCPPDLYF